MFALLGLAVALFLGRTRLAESSVSQSNLRAGHAWALGATIALAELPTARNSSARR